MTVAELLHPIRTRRTRRRLQAAAQARLAWWQHIGGLPPELKP